MDLSKIPSIILDYSNENLNFHTIPWNRWSKLQLSDLDMQLRSEWEAALSTNVFLHGVESEPFRMSGQKGYVAVLCRNRATHKRKPQSFTHILQKADPNSFNFTKVKPGEVLFCLESVSDRSNIAASSSERTAVIINNSPYEYSHCLLIPNINRCLIQSITLEAIQLSIQLLLRSRHPGFRLMYNSLCAGASVNHLHMHFYYTEYWLPSEAFQMHHILLNRKPADFFELDFMDAGVRGFGFVITKENYNNRLPSMLHEIVQYFNEHNIAHNIVMIRGIPPSSDYLPTLKDHISDDNQEKHFNEISQNPSIPLIERTTAYTNAEHILLGLRTSPLLGRVYIFPRLSLYGQKCYRKFHVNVTELFGHLYFGDADVFENMDENDVIRELNAVSLSDEHFTKVKSDVIAILSNL